MRILPIICAIKLCVFGISYCVNIDDYDMNPCYGKRWNVVLVRSVDEKHRQLNKIFEKSFHKLSPVIGIVNLDRNDYMTPKLFLFSEKHFGSRVLLKNLINYQNHWVHQSSTNEYKAVVHLYSKYFYQSNYNEIKKCNFIYAGDLPTGKYEVTKCQKRISQQNYCINSKKQKECIENNSTMFREDCVPTNVTKYIAKLVSDNILEFPGLYEYIYNFDGDKIDNNIELCNSPTNIIICGSNKEYFNSWDYPFKIKHQPNCRKIKADPRTIAILAPKQFAVAETTNITTIFYDDYLPELLPETAYLFNNAMPGILFYKIMFAIHKFMQVNGWSRVAIISDSSTASKKFEQELISLFEKDNVIYVSRSCDVMNCDFAELLKPLAANAKLIIANFGEEYMNDLTEQVMKLPVQTKLAWIFRGWSKKAAGKVKNMEAGDVFSITIGSDKVSDKDKQKSLLDTLNDYLLLPTYEDGMGPEIFRNHMTNYDDILSYLRNGTEPEKNKKHREIATHFRRKIYEETVTKAVVTWYTNSAIEIAEITISPSNYTKYYSIGQNLPHYIKTDIDSCSFKSKVYMKPCNDEEFMLLVFVLCVFLLMVAVILYFFQSAEMSYSRMR